jgi:DNA adenine methylase
MEKVRPFVKWAGGKNKLIPQMEQYYPKELKENKIDVYIEPFVGGGAILMDILKKYNIKKAYAFDINKNLINCYNIIKDKVESLVLELKKLEEEYLKLDDENRKEYYYDIRKKYNSINIENENEALEKTTYFIFLNKTCFNGLYRENRRGQFNVPIGKYKNPTIFDEENLIELSKLIKNVTFINGDYRESYKYIEENTFIYFDPPYRPINKTSSFTSYSKEDFNDENQKELGEYFRKINDNNSNVKLMLSNSNPKNNNEKDDFFEQIYNGFKINEIKANRMINSNKEKRGKISELLIINYEEY